MRNRNYSRRPRRVDSPSHNREPDGPNNTINSKYLMNDETFCQRITKLASFLFFPAPPKFNSSNGRRKTLCLDLDETLIHTSPHLNTERGYVPPLLRLDVENTNSDNTKSRVWYVRIRPHLSAFLKECTKLFEVAIFTASEKSYANPIIASIFSEAGCDIPRQCYYRSSCDPIMGMHIKDLSKVRHDLSKVILLDNSPSASAYQPTNLMTISTWKGEANDTELLDTLELLRILSTVSDVRNILNLRLAQRIERVSMTADT
jgi:Dullard-like phosphatase family protein